MAYPCMAASPGTCMTFHSVFGLYLNLHSPFREIVGLSVPFVSAGSWNVFPVVWGYTDAMQHHTDRHSPIPRKILLVLMFPYVVSRKQN